MHTTTRKTLQPSPAQSPPQPAASTRAGQPRPPWCHCCHHSGETPWGAGGHRPPPKAARKPLATSDKGDSARWVPTPGEEAARRKARAPQQLGPADGRNPWGEATSPSQDFISPAEKNSIAKLEKLIKVDALLYMFCGLLVSHLGNRTSLF